VEGGREGLVEGGKERKREREREKACANSGYNPMARSFFEQNVGYIQHREIYDSI